MGGSDHRVRCVEHGCTYPSGTGLCYKGFMQNENQERRPTLSKFEGLRSIRGTITSANTSELTARDFTTARAKRASLGGQVAQKVGTMKVSECRALSLKRKEKKDEHAWKKRRKMKSGQKSKQTLSSCLRLNFLLEVTT